MKNSNTTPEKPTSQVKAEQPIATAVTKVASEQPIATAVTKVASEQTIATAVTKVASEQPTWHNADFKFCFFKLISYC